MTELHLVAGHGAVAEHRFGLPVGGEQVPGLLWTAPGGDEPRPARAPRPRSRSLG
jgi:hypothetical protein